MVKSPLFWLSKVMTAYYPYVILGGGLVAGYAAQEFVKQGVAPGKLCILSAEKTLPYERPPLSKAFLAGKKQKPDILINKPDFYEENGIEVRLETAVQKTNLRQQQLETADETIIFEKLLIATGARPQKLDLPGAELENIFYLRQVEDSERIRQMAKGAKTAVVLGASFIGMEVTAVLQSSGVPTTLIFPGERVWESFFTPRMSAFFEGYYRERGVIIQPQQEIVEFRGRGPSHDPVAASYVPVAVSHAMTKTGQLLPADMVVAGIGVVLNTELFTNEDLHLVKQAIPVNEFLETTIPNVYAAGDVTYYQNVVYGRNMHVEHWDNAVQQGQHAARVMLGQREPFVYVPYFFSDVFDLSYEFWGDTTNAAETVHRGDVANGRFSVWWLAEDGRVLAAFVMNRPEQERELAPALIQAAKQLPGKWSRD
jgi:NADPH-dependent 2,4-dienoyl-CoA reductase/sulfur reductase-like enzyme